MEHALTESERLYRDLFGNAPVGLGIADKNGNLIAFNDAMLMPGGYTREDIERLKNVAELYYDREERSKVLAIARKQGFLHRHRIQFKRKDGTPYDTLLSLRFIMYQGSPCLQAMVEDITERQKMEDALQMSEKRYRELFEDSPISLMETDLSGIRKYFDTLKDSGIRDFRTYFREDKEALIQCVALIKIVDMNNETLDLFKAATKQEFIENFRHIFHEESYDFFREDMIALAEGRKGHEHESVARTFAGDKINILFKWFIASGYEETLSKVIASFIDITAQKHTEEDRDRIFNMSYDLICVAGTDGYFKFLNLAWERMLGYTREELLSRPFLDFIHPDDHHKNDEEVARLAAGHVTVDFENRYIHKDGSIRTLSWSATPLPEKGLMYCIGRDITKRKKDEQLIRSYQDQLSSMASRLSLIEEKERRKIALELHDNIGQILALARLKVGQMRKTSDNNVRNSMEEIHSLLDQSIKYTRSLTSELSTPMLYEIGLEPAVRWLGEEFQRKHGITFSLREDGKNGPLPEEVRVVLFQCIQELMTNVVKHAQAHNVRVSIERKNHSIEIAVEDDGAGFDTGSSDRPYMKCGFGLFSVRERLKNIGGHLDVKSQPGSGTRVTMTAPLNKEVVS
jgi:PAS domain S-box-containing protein